MFYLSCPRLLFRQFLTFPKCNICYYSHAFVLQTDPKRLKKDLPKILKTLKPEDRVLIVGTSRMPFGIL